MPSNVWDEIAYSSPNFVDCTVELWEWISNFIQHIILDAITYLCFGAPVVCYMAQETVVLLHNPMCLILQYNEYWQNKCKE